MELYHRGNALCIAAKNEAKKVLPQALFVPLCGVTLTKFETFTLLFHDKANIVIMGNDSHNECVISLW